MEPMQCSWDGALPVGWMPQGMLQVDLACRVAQCEDVIQYLQYSARMFYSAVQCSTVLCLAQMLQRDDAMRWGQW